ncbi:MAG: nucleotidyltransferase domain-containing protein [Deltaproteobacteria bacterium]|jgi:predicted nucleotidyltransferase|nr:nucleotidyltransferase domain-containing protein [Deltaproteobacteria bacterium]
MPATQKKDEIASIVSVIKNTVDCDKIYLFGSYAYGEPTEDSDFDFYVVVPGDSGKTRNLRSKIRRALSDVTQASVDILASYAGRFAELSILPTLENTIVHEGILLYERI